MSKIAFLGLGAMGSRMAARLLDGGHAVSVWNRSPDAAQALAAAGARVAATPGDAAQGAEFVIAMVRDDDASRAVWTGEDGALASMAEGAIAIESSTLTPLWVRALAELAAKRNLVLLDAPVVGSRPQADAGKLIYLVGGPEDALERVTPILLAMGAAVHHAGPTGCGAALKLFVNALFGIQVAALAETLPMLRHAGADLDQAVKILGEVPVMSPAAKAAAASILAGAFQPQFPVELVEKDFGYVLAMGSDAPLVQATRAVLQRALAAGLGAENLTGIARLYDK